MSSNYSITTKNKKMRLHIMLVILMIVAGFGAIAFSGFGQGEDPGVKACSDMAERFNHPSTKSNDPLTETQYHDMRKPFETSAYTDINVAGTNLVDTVYKAQGKIDSMDLVQALDLTTTIKTQWGNLQTACMKHGVNLPGLPT